MPFPRKPLILLAHYLIVIAVPLTATVLLFKFLEGNVAEYRQAHTGVRLGGPVAAFVILFAITNRQLGRIFRTWRDEERHEQSLQNRDISDDDAMILAGRYSTLLARFLLVELLLLRTQGWKLQDFNSAVSFTRKRMYGFQNLVGDVTIRKGGFKLSDILGAAINNPTFLDKLKAEVAQLLVVPPAYLLANPQFANPQFAVQSSTSETLKNEDTLSQEKFYAMFERVMAKLESELPASGLHYIESSLTNAIWRECEEAIKRPEEVMRKKFSPP